MTDPDLSRFITAQDKVIAVVEAELAAGRKRTHWMWFVFPQVAGLGLSETARTFAVADLDQARRYLADPVLGERLRRHVRMTLSHKDRTANQIFGTPDDLKFRSCLTLFRAAAADSDDRHLLEEGLRQFYGGEPDPRSIELLFRI
jgi:uncharacterized protein (DUF1810 family)